jgi:hypothetical protein
MTSGVEGVYAHSVTPFVPGSQLAGVGRAMFAGWPAMAAWASRTVVQVTVTGQPVDGDGLVDHHGLEQKGLVGGRRRSREWGIPLSAGAPGG